MKKGVARFEAYRDIQRVAFASLESGEQFLDAVSKDAAMTKHLSKKEIASIFDAKTHLAASGKIVDDIAKMVSVKCRR